MHDTVSDRVLAARQRARDRLVHQGAQLSPLRLVVAAVVVGISSYGKPAPGFHGKALVIMACLVVVVVGIFLVRTRREEEETSNTWQQVMILLLLGAAGIGLDALQSQASSELPATIAIFMAAMRLAPLVAAVVELPVMAAIGIVAGIDSDAQNVVAVLLLCVVLGVSGALIRQSRLNQERTELLLAELEDARDDQARAAAAAERTRIARDLHDVLAHSLSGLAIQMEAARQLARNDEATPELRDLIDRASDLAKQGLTESRRAVGALRGDDAPTVDRIPELVAQYRRDLGLSVNLRVEGAPQPVSPEVGLTLYRAVGEALTNVSRYAPGAQSDVSVRWSAGEVSLRVVDHGGTADTSGRDAGGGWGLIGMRERVSRLGGRCLAGPQGAGWSVDIVVPV